MQRSTYDARRGTLPELFFFYRYGSLAKAAAKPDGLAVLGTFFHIQKEDNSVFSDLTKKLQQIQEPHEISENLSGLSLASFIPPMGSKTTEFFRYEGSLTTPGCYESVTWTVFRHALAISEEQMASFRALYDGQGQPLHCKPLPCTDYRDLPV